MKNIIDTFTEKSVEREIIEKIPTEIVSEHKDQVSLNITQDIEAVCVKDEIKDQITQEDQVQIEDISKTPSLLTSEPLDQTVSSQEKQNIIERFIEDIKQGDLELSEKPHSEETNLAKDFISIIESIIVEEPVKLSEELQESKVYFKKSKKKKSKSHLSSFDVNSKSFESIISISGNTSPEFHKNKSHKVKLSKIETGASVKIEKDSKALSNYSLSKKSHFNKPASLETRPLQKDSLENKSTHSNKNLQNTPDFLFASSLISLEQPKYFNYTPKDITSKSSVSFIVDKSFPSSFDQSELLSKSDIDVSGIKQIANKNENSGNSKSNKLQKDKHQENELRQMAFLQYKPVQKRSNKPKTIQEDLKIKPSPIITKISQSKSCDFKEILPKKDNQLNPSSSITSGLADENSQIISQESKDKNSGAQSKKSKKSKSKAKKDDPELTANDQSKMSLIEKSLTIESSDKVEIDIKNQFQSKAKKLKEGSSFNLTSSQNATSELKESAQNQSGLLNFPEKELKKESAIKDLNLQENLIVKKKKKPKKKRKSLQSGIEKTIEETFGGSMIELHKRVEDSPILQESIDLSKAGENELQKSIDKYNPLASSTSSDIINLVNRIESSQISADNVSFELLNKKYSQEFRQKIHPSLALSQDLLEESQSLNNETTSDLASSITELNVPTSNTTTNFSNSIIYSKGAQHSQLVKVKKEISQTGSSLSSLDDDLNAKITKGFSISASSSNNNLDDSMYDATNSLIQSNQNLNLNQQNNEDSNYEDNDADDLDDDGDDNRLRSKEDAKKSLDLEDERVPDSTLNSTERTSIDESFNELEFSKNKLFDEFEQYADEPNADTPAKSK